MRIERDSPDTAASREVKGHAMTRAIQLPRLTDSEDYAAALATFDRLRAQRREIEMQKSRLIERRSNELSEARAAKQDREALALLDGRSIDIESASILDKQIRDCVRELPIFNRAIQLAEDSLEKAHAAAVREIHAVARKPLQAAGAALAKAIFDCHDVATHCASLASAIADATDQRPRFELCPQPPFGAVLPALVNAAKVLAEHGYIEPRDIPDSFFRPGDGWHELYKLWGTGPITRATEAIMSDKPRPIPKRAAPTIVQAAVSRIRGVPQGHTRVRLTRIVGAPVPLCVGEIVDLPNAQAQSLFDAQAAEPFSGKAKDVRQSSLTDAATDDDSEWRAA